MFNFDKALELPSQLQWKYADEPELLGWTIRARNYNTFVANAMFWFCFTATTAGSILLYRSMDNDPVFSGILTLLFFITVNIALTSITHQRMNFAYRFTQSGVEYCKWKDFPKWALTFLKWFAGITAIIFIFLATIDPAFLIGVLIGPGGMGLMYLSMANSKSYQEMQTEYHHYAFKWAELTQLAIATNREVVDLKYSITLEGKDYITNWSLNVFCKRKQKGNVAKLIKPYLSPGVPFIKAKVNVPLSTD
ncbi:hypothetical protein C1Y08_16115 [Pseudomonas sp. FW306-02-F02-AA]|uniref:Uncharacterized protein n=1 Tax=Pseudomonas fluorescens TaxID=294 RepID=A0A0N9VPA4_PSEFL|nr:MULTISPECIES: hypothetical protein [Pseudomonas]ALI01904.1 hypothetical protein AO353_12725 [Pseudomonas fluorescens]PMZ05383.1 hypothetical protein C1Y07_05425 [Pseudomonas sp. FW306-02-F02-AB]PMZ09288.1 hypothetical protein C1Y06_15365 [Pseudomonas sp. FW306-02-H06C]PMZ15000.1 hypothetical protein C1Y08_16115 [Pseudomonas sp. FW306-02-F02-AA]PMZ20187.1 hypothetical protein C1Y09_20350 [Pseudomonas sp. FW306-02-F08-AA]